MAPADSSQEFIERLASAVLDKQLYKIRDKEEEPLIDNIIYLFYELERYTGISEIEDSEEGDRLYSFGLLNNAGLNEKQKTYRLPKPKIAQMNQKKEQIMKVLSGDKNLDVCVLLEILAEKMK